MSHIHVYGARQHNLRGVDVCLPRDALVVITGPSGSGKSSLAFDTLYAESQRLYVEALSPFARQLLGQLPRPAVDRIDGLSPAIALRQQAGRPGPRSTVGTLTEILDYLRLLYARIGVVHCPGCGSELRAHSAEQVVDNLLSAEEGSRFALTSPLGSFGPDALQQELSRLRSEGYVRVRLNGQTYDLSEELPRAKCTALEVVIDRVRVKVGVRSRVNEAVELAMTRSGGRVRVVAAEGPERLFSGQLECLECELQFGALSPTSFSFNSPQGACATCGGLGAVYGFDEASVVPDPSLSLEDGAIAPWGRAQSKAYRTRLEALKTVLRIALDRPWRKLSAAHRRQVLHGKPGRGERAAYEGVLPSLTRQMERYRRGRDAGTEGDTFAELETLLTRFARPEPCGECTGTRLGALARIVKVAGMDLGSVLTSDLTSLAQRLGEVSVSEGQSPIAQPLLADVSGRLDALLRLGLGYLSLARGAATLSAGELQRIRMATQLGSGLLGVLYVLDEPSSGLHPADTQRLVDALHALRDRGNSVVVVEHDESVLRAADYLVDLGPGAGAEGGRLLGQGTPDEVSKVVDSPTAALLRGELQVVPPARRRRGRAKVRLSSVHLHNLQDVEMELPVGVLTCVTGVSGSGKSSLVVDALVPAVRDFLAGREPIGLVLEGAEAFDRLLQVDQAPIGRSPRSTPASYLGIYAELREIFAALPQARTRGWGSGRFSFNVRGGRCDVCQGAGVSRVAMHFLPDVFVRCDACQGSRFNRETLDVRYRGYSIADILAMRVVDAVDQLASFPALTARLGALLDVGLGYLELGQRASTLSGGEAQRVKLARELSRRATGNSLVVLDEPTSGLHACDVKVLLEVFDRLVDAGNTLIVIEHHPMVMMAADHLLDMGPGAGPHGGQVVACGTPEELAVHPTSVTAPFLSQTVRV